MTLDSEHRTISSISKSSTGSAVSSNSISNMSLASSCKLPSHSISTYTKLDRFKKFVNKLLQFSFTKYLREGIANLHPTLSSYPRLQQALLHQQSHQLHHSPASTYSPRIWQSPPSTINIDFICEEQYNCNINFHAKQFYEVLKKIIRAW